MVKFLLLKSEDLSLDTEQSQKGQLCTPVTPSIEGQGGKRNRDAGSRDLKNPGACWPVRLAKTGELQIQ